MLFKDVTQHQWRSNFPTVRASDLESHALNTLRLPDALLVNGNLLI